MTDIRPHSTTHEQALNETVSGWLMLDPEHPDQVGKTRGTIWEIHPVMRMEVEQQGRWVPLDSYTGK